MAYACLTFLVYISDQVAPLRHVMCDVVLAIAGQLGASNSFVSGVQDLLSFSLSFIPLCFAFLLLTRTVNQPIIFIVVCALFVI